MEKKPLKVLRLGLTRLKENIKARKVSLSTRLFNRERISEKDEHWLDNDANFVDEDALVDLLDKASDYERGLERLNSQQKILLEKLKELGGGIDGTTEEDIYQVVLDKHETVLLASFGRQTRLDISNSLQPTTLTNFFILRAS